MPNDTSRAFHALWNSQLMQEALLQAFFVQVFHERKKREEIDSWLRELGTDPENPVCAALLLARANPFQVRWERLTDFLCDCYYVQMNDPLGLAKTPTDEELDNDEALGGRPLYPARERIIRRSVPFYLLPLEQILLSSASAHGLEATRMVYRGPDPDLAALLARGEAFLAPVDLQRGKTSQCHENSARLWRRQHRALSLVTGYGLSDDGLFRQHTWLLRNAPKVSQARIIETTEPRILYYGYVLTRSEAQQFCAAELD